MRAYPESESAGDVTAVARMELLYALPRFPEVQALVFADAGAVRTYRSRIASDTDNSRTLTGEGLGLQWIRAGSFGAKAYVAWRSGSEPTSGADRSPRFWMQAAKYF